MELIRYSTLLIVILACVWIYCEQKRNTEFPAVETKKGKYYFRIMPVILAAMLVYLIWHNRELSVFALWKAGSVLALVWLIAYVDYKVQLIPNRYLLAALIVRGIIFLFELINAPARACTQIISELLGGAMLLAFCFLLRILSRKGMGMGDVKLFSVLPLFLGIWGGFRALIYAMIIIFIQSVVCLITKKKGKSDVIAFGPAIAGGVWIAVFISGL